jgi:hypothetical protein
MEKSTPCVNSTTKNCTDFVTKRGEISCDKCIAEKQSLFVAKKDETVRGYISTISALEQENKALVQENKALKEMISSGTSENVDTMEIDNLRLELSLIQLKLKEMELIREELGQVQKEKMILEQTVSELKQVKRTESPAEPSRRISATPSPRDTPTEPTRRISATPSPRDTPRQTPSPRDKDSPKGIKRADSGIKRGGPKVLREGRNSPSPEPIRVKKSPRDSMIEFKQSVEDSLPMDDSKETEKKASR